MKRLRPSESNRELVVADLAKEAMQRGERQLADIARHQVHWDLATDVDWHFCCAASSSFYAGVEVALMYHLKGNTELASEWLAKSLMYGQRGALLNSTMVNFALQDRDHPDFSTAIDDRRLPEVIGFLAATGQHDALPALCQFWHQLLQNPVFIDMFIGIDPWFIAFQRELMLALHTGQWPQIQHNTALISELGGFSALLRTKPTDADFSQNFAEYLDFRLANIYGYDHVFAEKRRPSGRSFPSSVFQGSTGYMLLPFELFMFAWVWQQVSGENWQLPTDHPFMQVGWTQLPEIKAFPLDDNVRKFDGFAGKFLGERWRQLAAVTETPATPENAIPATAVKPSLLSRWFKKF